MTQSIARTNTPQEYFAHVGNLESQDALALIAQKMLNHEQCGLKQACLDREEEKLLQAFDTQEKYQPIFQTVGGSFIPMCRQGTLIYPKHSRSIRLLFLCALFLFLSRVS